MIFNSIKTAILAMVVSLLAPFSHAVLIGFEAADQTVYLGDSASVNLIVSDFDANESLGDYDLNLSFDSAILNISSVTFGNELGFSMAESTNQGAGTVNMNELSWESANYLDNNQSNRFTLATLTFDTLNIGLSSLDISSVFALGDQNGAWLDFSLASGTIEVIEKLVDVPEPGSLALFAFGIVSIGVLRRRFVNVAS